MMVSDGRMAIVTCVSIAATGPVCCSYYSDFMQTIPFLSDSETQHVSRSVAGDG